MRHHIKKLIPCLGPLFKNPWHTAKTPRLLDLLKVLFVWITRRGIKLNGSLMNNLNPSKDKFREVFPLIKVDWLRWNREENDIKCVWIGHATCYVKIHDIAFITDPIFSTRCSPFQFIGPKRVVDPPFRISDPNFTKLDFVIISHSHYDHLDYQSVVDLYKKFGDDLVWYVPLNMTRWFTRVGIKSVIELDWWQTLYHDNAKITFLPAQHWSNRQGLVDINRVLWGSWLIENGNPTNKVWFAGDTAYCPVFREIGSSLGPFDLSLIPIGAYNPRFFMKYQHVNPEEALQIHQEVKSKRSLAIHCCTFPLTLEPMDEPPQLLLHHLMEKGIPKEEFLTIAHGEIIHLRNNVLMHVPKLLPTTMDFEARPMHDKHIHAS